MTLINQSQFLLTLPKSLFYRIMGSAYAHNREPMAEFIYRLYRSFDIVPGTPEEAKELERLLKQIQEKSTMEDGSESATPYLGESTGDELP